MEFVTAPSDGVLPVGKSDVGAVDEGWLEISLEASPPKSRGRPGQTYRITEEGRSVTLDEAKRLRDLAAVALSADPRLDPESADA